MEITKNKVAGIHYTLRDNTGIVIDTSDGREPLYYLQLIFRGFAWIAHRPGVYQTKFMRATTSGSEFRNRVVKTITNINSIFCAQFGKTE